MSSTVKNGNLEVIREEVRVKSMDSKDGFASSDSCHSASFHTGKRYTRVYTREKRSLMDRPAFASFSKADEWRWKGDTRFY